MQHAPDAFDDFGGHEFSGGFSLRDENVHTLQEKLEASLASLGQSFDEVDARNEVEGILTIAEANESAYRALRELAPFGEGNPKPMFRIEDSRVDKLSRFGGGSEHARIVLSDENGRQLDAITFFVSRQKYRDTLDLLSVGDRVSVEGSIEQSFFRGLKELRFRLENIALVR
jgi:single-stranded-DNA-specific exonuclease